MLNSFVVLSSKSHATDLEIFDHIVVTRISDPRKKAAQRKVNCSPHKNRLHDSTRE